LPEKAIISKLKNKLQVTVFEKYSFDIEDFEKPPL